MTKAGDGKLAILRTMLAEHVRREGSDSSFSMRSGLLLELLDELMRARAEQTA
jgi:hypothetical protein